MKQRFHTLDTFRGLVIINMIAYHFLYDVFVIFGDNPFWYRNPGIHAWQQFICCSFIILSGFVWPYGRGGKLHLARDIQGRFPFHFKNLRRGIFINVMGLVITVFTLIVTPDQVICFGILTFLGCAVLLTIPLEPLLRRIPPAVGVISFFAAFLLLRNVNNGTFGFGPCHFGQVPQILYQHPAMIPFGFPTDSFFSSDYFSLLPWYLLYLFGYFLGRMLEKKEWFTRLMNGRIPIINWMGRHSIWIYMIHQIACYGICMLIFTT